MWTIAATAGELYVVQGPKVAKQIHYVCWFCGKSKQKRAFFSIPMFVSIAFLLLELFVYFESKSKQIVMTKTMQLFFVSN